MTDELSKLATSELARRIDKLPVYGRAFVYWRAVVALRPLIDSAPEIPADRRRWLHSCIGALRQAGLSGLADFPDELGTEEPFYLRLLYRAASRLIRLAQLDMQESVLVNVIGRSGMPKLDGRPIMIGEALATVRIACPEIEHVLSRELDRIEAMQQTSLRDTLFGELPTEDPTSQSQVTQHAPDTSSIVASLRADWPTPPTVLYRYRPTKDIERDIYHAIRGEHWYSSPLAFNDPYDCRPLVPRPDKEDFIKAYSQLGIPGAFTPEEVYERLDNPQNIENGQRQAMLRWGILCLSETSASTQMWAHYASSYAGCVLGLRTSGLWPARAQSVGLEPNVLKVRYSNERPTFEPFLYGELCQEETIKRLFGHKAQGWSYEGEWRSVFPLPKKGPGALIKGEFDCLQEVYFGHKVDAGTRARIINTYLRDRPIRVHVLSERLPRGSSYELEFEQLQ